MKICSVENCSAKTESRGLCHTHYVGAVRRGEIQTRKMVPFGSGHVDHRGVRFVGINGKPRREHVLIVEEVLGHSLKPGQIVHHADLNPSNNSHGNLVVCPDDAYHKLLHQRTRAAEASGHADWLKCWLCKQYDYPLNLVGSSGHGHYHRKCAVEYRASVRLAA